MAVLLNGNISVPEVPIALASGDFTGCPNADCFKYSDGFRALASGLCCGISGLGAGMAIGVVGDAGVRAVGQQEKLFVGMILILIFAEALGLYGLIVALVLSQG